MIAFEVHVQELLLSEGLLTLAACVRFLSSMGAAMHYHVALLNYKTEFSKPEEFILTRQRMNANLLCDPLTM